MQATNFIKGSYYLIICKNGEQALRIEQNNPAKFDNSRIIGAQANVNDNGQIFMIQKVGDKEDEYEIVNCVSTYIFDEESGSIKLKYGKKKKDQLFAIVNAVGKYYWIKTDMKGNKALSLEGELRYEKFNESKDSQLFRFELVNNNNNSIKNSCLIINNFSGKVLDVPYASTKQGQRIIQWQKNKRWNQRWCFVKNGKAILIKSLFNGLCLDIQGESRSNGAKVIQWKQTGGSNQLWYAEPCGNGVYKFRSTHEQSLYLSIKKQKSDNGCELEVASDENYSMYWRFEGAQP